MSGKAPDLTAEAEALARALLDPVYYEMGYGYEPTVEHLALISQALAAVDQRAYARGIEEAAKVCDEKAVEYERETWPSSGNSEADRTFSRAVAVRLIGLSTAIRQLLEVKG